MRWFAHTGRRLSCLISCGIGVRHRVSQGEQAFLSFPAAKGTLLAWPDKCVRSKNNFFEFHCVVDIGIRAEIRYRDRFEACLRGGTRAGPVFSLATMMPIPVRWVEKNSVGFHLQINSLAKPRRVPTRPHSGQVETRTYPARVARLCARH